MSEEREQLHNSLYESMIDTLPYEIPSESVQRTFWTFHQGATEVLYFQHGYAGLQAIRDDYDSLSRMTKPYFNDIAHAVFMTEWVDKAYQRHLYNFGKMLLDEQ